MYHFTYDFWGFGGTRRRRAILLKTWRADIVAYGMSYDDRGWPLGSEAGKRAGKLVIDFKRRKAAIGGNLRESVRSEGISRPWSQISATMTFVTSPTWSILEMSFWFLVW
jgi:hypothetical protein